MEAVIIRTIIHIHREMLTHNNQTNKPRVAGTLNTSQAYLRIRLSILHVHFLTAGSAGGLCFTIA